MGRTLKYFISILLILFSGTLVVNAQDTIDIPLKVRIGIEVVGPVKYFIDKNELNLEASVNIDLNEKRSFFLAAGYTDYKYSQYNYSYASNGIFALTGFDFNLMNIKKAQGRYWGGVGLHYGISRFSYAYPSYEQENFWGTAVSSVPNSTNWGHFIEISPGARAELFKNFSMGWSLNLKFLVYTGAGRNIRPIYLPGFGNAGKTFSPTINYFLVWNIPFKKIKVIFEKPVPEETDDKGKPASAGSSQQMSGKQ